MSAPIQPGRKEMHKFSSDGTNPTQFHTRTMDETEAGIRKRALSVQYTNKFQDDLDYSLTIVSNDPSGEGTSFSETQVKSFLEKAEFDVTSFNSSTEFVFSISTPTSCEGAVEITY